MPNHVTTRCVINGPAEQVAAFRAATIITKLEERGEFWPADRVPELVTRFEFDAIIPKPAALADAEESTTAEEGVALIAARGSRGAPFDDLGLYQVQIDRIRTAAGLPRDAHIADVAVAYLAAKPEVERAGKARMRALLETGYASWYPWSIANWGTKWGAYSFELESEEPLSIKFDTAWSFPTPIFKALVVQYPDLTFDCVTFDEGWNFAGEGQFGRDVTTPFSTRKATAELYERVYGHAPERDEDEAA